MSETLASSAAGTTKIIELVLLTGDGYVLDMTNRFRSLEYFEDMFSPFITGRVAVIDTTDALSIMTWGGKDLIRFKFCSMGLDENDPKNTIEGTYGVYKVGDRLQGSDGSIEMKLYFASIEMMIDIQSQVGNSFIKKTPRQVLDTVFKDRVYRYAQGITQKQLITNEDKNPITRLVSFVSNRWSPSKVFKYLENHTIDDSGDATYLFFENKYGFNFLNLTDIVQLHGGPGKDLVPFMEISDSNFKAEYQDLVSGGIRVIPTPDRDSKIITGARRIGSYDSLKSYQDGRVRVNLHSYDILKQEYEHKTYIPADVLPKTPLLNDSYPFKVEPTDKFGESDALLGLPVQVSAHYDVIDRTEETNSNVFQMTPRMMGITNFMNNSIEIDLMGRTDSTVGIILRVNLSRKVPRYKGMPEDEYTDFKYTGDYICTAISHKITPDTKHTMVLELARDGIKDKK